MSGGGKGVVAPTTSNAVTATKPAYLKNATSAMQPAGLPGQLPTIAQELAMGFGVPQQMMTDAIYGMYQPAATMNFNAPPKTAPKVVAPKTTTKPAPKPVTSPLNFKLPTTKTPSQGRNAR